MAEDRRPNKENRQPPRAKGRGAPPVARRRIARPAGEAQPAAEKSRPQNGRLGDLAIRKVDDLPEYDCLLSGRPQAPIRLKLEGSAAHYACVLVKVVDPDGQSVSFSSACGQYFDSSMWRQSDLKVRVYYLVTGVFRDQYRQEFSNLVEMTHRKFGKDRVYAETLTVSAPVIDAVHEQFQSRVTQEEAEDQEMISRAQEEFTRICQMAMNENASDIHFDVSPLSTNVFYRIDGQLRKQFDMSKSQADAICQAAYNTLSEVGSTKDSFNPSKYQNAVIDMRLRQGHVRLRFASLPVAPAGYNVVLRLLPIGVQQKHKTYEELGYSKDQSGQIRRAFGRASGIVIIAGTTGSGKSTTLQNATEAIHHERPAWKLRSLEEPVEYRIQGCSQTPILRNDDDREGGSASKPFTDALKACMRADPDFLLIGEVRDKETAELAFQAAQTGHQVATTLHTDSWIGVVERLRLMGIEYGSIAQPGLLSGLVYQKLVPVLCPDCKRPVDSVEFPSEKDKETLTRLRHVTTEQDRKHIFIQGPGCPSCNARGTRGRTICAEVAVVTDKMLRFIARGDLNGAIREWRHQITNNPNDMRGRWAFEHAFWKMKEGFVSPFDVESAFRYLDEIDVVGDIGEEVA